MKAVVPKSRAATGQLERFFGWVPEAAGALARWLVEISRSGASGKPQCFPAFPLPTDCSVAITSSQIQLPTQRRCKTTIAALSRAWLLLAARPTDVQPPAAVAYRLVQS